MIISTEQPMFNSEPLTEKCPGIHPVYSNKYIRRNKMMHTVEEIVSIKKTEVLFYNDTGRTKNKYRELVKRFHPDYCDKVGCVEAFQHITRLYNEALEKITDGTWGFCGVLYVKDDKFEYHRKREFELGVEYIGKEHILYEIDRKHMPYLNHFLCVVPGLDYDSRKLKDEFQRCFPMTIGVDDNIIRVKKPVEVIRLRDVLDHFDGAVDPKSVAWIMSTLYNILCYLSHINIVHGDITIDNYYINPEKHSGKLLGGWWYYMTVGHKFRSLPEKNFSLASFRTKNTGIADTTLDAELVLNVGRELLGDSKVPFAMLKWFDRIAEGDAIENYKKWEKVLVDSWGPRRFHKMGLTAGMVY